MTLLTAPVGELTEILSGFAFKSEQFNNSGEGLPLIRIRDVIEGTSDTYYSGDYKSEFLIKNGDALIGMDGQFNLACWRGGPALLNQRVCKIKATDERLDQGYLLRFLPSALKEIEDRTPFVTVKHLSVKSLREIEISLPPLLEQRRIAAILDKADALRAKRREAIAKLDQLLQSVFLEMFGDPVTNPKGWPMKFFGEVCESSFRNGLSPSTSGSVPGKVLTLSAITGQHFQSHHQKEALFDRYPSDNQRVKIDTFLICRGNGNRQLVGVGVFPSHDLSDVCFPDTIIGANIAKDRVSPRFMEQIWGSSLVRNQIESGARTTNGTFKINQKTLEKISIPIPPRELQEHFESISTKLMTLRSMMSVSAGLINENFRSLQQRIFGAL
jgi:type I restriction enzyme S subunit